MGDHLSASDECADAHTKCQANKLHFHRGTEEQSYDGPYHRSNFRTYNKPTPFKPDGWSDHWIDNRRAKQ
jgi:hypothetical protein